MPNPRGASSRARKLFDLAIAKKENEATAESSSSEHCSDEDKEPDSPCPSLSESVTGEKYFGYEEFRKCLVPASTPQRKAQRKVLRDVNNDQQKTGAQTNVSPSKSPPKKKTRDSERPPLPKSAALSLLLTYDSENSQDSMGFDVETKSNSIGTVAKSVSNRDESKSSLSNSSGFHLSDLDISAYQSVVADKGRVMNSTPVDSKKSLNLSSPNTSGLGSTIGGDSSSEIFEVSGTSGLKLSDADLSASDSYNADEGNEGDSTPGKTKYVDSNDTRNLSSSDSSGLGSIIGHNLSSEGSDSGLSASPNKNEDKGSKGNSTPGKTKNVESNDILNLSSPTTFGLVSTIDCNLSSEDLEGSETSGFQSSDSVLSAPQTKSAGEVNISTETMPESDNRRICENEKSSNAAEISITFTEPVTEELCAEICAVVTEAHGDALVLPWSPEPLDENPVEGQEAEGVDPTNDADDVTPAPVWPKPRRSMPQTWKKNKVKELNDAGLAHTSLRGKKKPARSMKKGCSDKCQRQCQSNFSEEHRESIFKEFWGIKNHTMQWMFISKFVRPQIVKKRTVHMNHNESYRRNNSNYYFLPDENGIAKQVCLTMFLGTLGVAARWVRTSLEKHKKFKGAIPDDGRGKIKKETELSKETKDSVREHIKKFPTVEGHYTRKDSKALYLAENLNRRKMHHVYQMERKAERVLALAEKQKELEKEQEEAALLEENREESDEAKAKKFKEKLDKAKTEINRKIPIASLRQYRDIFRSDFKLKFHRSKKDQCPRCLSWKNKLPEERTEAAENKYRKHLSDKKLGSDLKISDIDLIKDSPELQKSLCVMTCDLEKVLYCPKGENSDFFYKSKLNVYNFTIFVSGDQEAFCFVWDQTMARKGAAEITSSLWLFIQEKVSKGIKEFRIYSDNCSAQNKNQYLFSMYVMASIRFQIKIVHRYLEVGHTHMEVDSVHACIENSVKKCDTIYTPAQWFARIKTAKKKRPFYNVIELTQEEILDFVPLASHQNWTKLKTSLFKEVVIDCAEPGMVAFKTEYEGEVTKVCVLKKAVGRPVNFKTISLKKRYNSRIPLRKNELDDLQSLCRSGAIPTPYASFYLERIPALVAQAVEPGPPVDLSDVESSDGEDPDESSDHEDSNGDDEDAVDSLSEEEY